MAGTKEEPLSVTEAVQVAKGQVAQIPTLSVMGEVSGFRGPNARSGHCYFEVKDATAAMSTIAWRGVYRDFVETSGTQLRDGLQIQMTGAFDVYQNTGKLSFVAKHITVAGEGLLRQQVAELARKLEREGLMDPARKRRIPAFCSRVCVVTSLSGSVIEDVKRTLRRRNPLVQIDAVGCAVQGKHAPATIIRALEVAAASKPDAILLVRGGGSFEDLMCFNDESVARAVASCPVPVVTGIGHEPDVSICDMVADRRCSTPTAAAESVAPDFSELQKVTHTRGERLASAMEAIVRTQGIGLDASERLMRKSLQGEVDRMWQRVEALASHRCLQEPGYLVLSREEQLAQTEQRLADALPRSLARKADELAQTDSRLMQSLPRVVLRSRQELAHEAVGLESAGRRLLEPHEAFVARSAATLDALSPLKVLGRGYALARDAQGHVVTDAARLAEGDEVRVSLAHGAFGAKVLQTAAN